MAGLQVPLSTLRLAPRDALRMTRGQSGLLFLHCWRLALFTLCRSPGAQAYDFFRFVRSGEKCRPKNGLNSSPNLPALCWPPVISPICRRLITLRLGMAPIITTREKKFLPATFWKWIGSVAVFLFLASAALLLPRDRSG